MSRLMSRIVTMFAGLRSCTRSQSWMLSPRLQCYATSASGGHNAAIIDMLKKERETYSKEHGVDGYKIRAFSNAIKVIEQFDGPIYSVMESSTVKGIGAGIAKRINKFLEMQHDPDHPHAAQFETYISQNHAREQFLQIPGVGVKKAQQFLDEGCKSIADLRSRKYMHLISKTQQVFVKYMEHIGNPVKRKEAELVAKFMQENLPSKYEIILAGDYRRGLSSFPHIDVVVSHPEHVEMPIPGPPRSNSRLHKSPALIQKNKIVSNKKHTNALLDYLLRTLNDRGLVCDALSIAGKKWGGIIRVPELERNSSDGKEKLAWRDKAKMLDDIAKLNGSFRRVNIVLTPQKARAATLFTTTGDVEFVKYVRHKALSLDLHLDDFGLWRWHPSGESAESTEEKYTPVANEDSEHPVGYWELFKISTEEDIFSSLNMEYVHPHRRNFRYLENHGKPRAIL